MLDKTKIVGWTPNYLAHIQWRAETLQLIQTDAELDSIFEKVRHCVAALPPIFRPQHFDASYMKMVNHDNGATITGESGDEIGRGEPASRI